jgi:hypothetical protein
MSLKKAAAAVTERARAAGHAIDVSGPMLRRVKALNPAPQSPVDPRNVVVTNPRGRPTHLPRHFELAMVDWVTTMGEIGCPPSKAMLKAHINHVLAESETTALLVDGMVDDKWVSDFMDRHGLRCFVESPIESLRKEYDQSCNSYIMYKIWEDVCVKAGVAVYTDGHGPESKPKFEGDLRIKILRPDLIVRLFGCVMEVLFLSLT